MDVDIVNIRHQIIFQPSLIVLLVFEITGGKKRLCCSCLVYLLLKTAAHNSSYWPTSGDMIYSFPRTEVISTTQIKTDLNHKDMAAKGDK